MNLRKIIQFYTHNVKTFPIIYQHVDNIIIMLLLTVIIKIINNMLKFIKFLKRKIINNLLTI